jgi:anti-sigma regulatory factor (Ser/Thr protein kinase)
MSVFIISDCPNFQQTVASILRGLYQHQPVTHLTSAEWDGRDLASVPASNLLIMDARSPIADRATDDCVFALVRRIERHLGEAESRWQQVSFEELTLWLHRDALLSTPHPGIHVRVLVNSPVYLERQLTMPSQQTLMPIMRDLLWQTVRARKALPDEYESRFHVAVGEALANAVFHGNLELCSSLKEEGDSAFSKLTSSRQVQEPYRSRRVTVTESVSRYGVWITVADEGKGFDVATALENCETADLLLSSGRGIMMMRGLSDDLFFSYDGAAVTLMFNAYAAGQNSVGKAAADEAASAPSAMLVGS